MGVALAIIGMTQERILPRQTHWIMLVTHLAVALAGALAVAGRGEQLAGRAAKARANAKRTARIARRAVFGL